jgi:hypothetical protein
MAIPAGALYRVIDAEPSRTAVRPEVAAELARVFDIFARDAGATEQDPVAITIRPGIFGHHQVGRAVDVYAVNKRGIDAWMDRWERMLAGAAQAATPLDRRLLREREENTNLGWRLYKAMQRYGRWAQPYGHPIQLFGPWTRSEGPWNFISDFLLRAHRDHIHVAK